MKNIIKVILLTVFVGFSTIVLAIEKEGTLEREFDVDQSMAIDFVNKNNDLEVKTWNKNKVKLDCYYKIRANDQEDIDMVIDALQELGVKQDDNTLSLTTSIFTNLRSTVITGVVNRIVGTLVSGPVVNLNQFKVEYVLTVPNTNALKLKQKYSDLNFADFTGDLELDLYDVDLYAGKLPNAKYLKSKYSKLRIASLGNAELDIYDTNINLELMGDLTLKSKYSKFYIDKLGAVTIDSYDDKFYLTELKSLEGKSKYSNFEIGDIEYGDLELYDCDIEGGDCGKMIMEAKYSGIHFDDVNIFELPESHDNKLHIKSVGEFSAKSKYTEFDFNQIKGMFDISTYDDKIEIHHVDSDFYFIGIEGKYTKANIKIEGNPKYFADFDFKYTKRSLPDNLMFSDLQTKSSQFIAKGRTEGLKKTDTPKIKKDENGVRKANIGEVVIKQYDGSLTIY